MKKIKKVRAPGSDDEAIVSAAVLGIVIAVIAGVLGFIGGIIKTSSAHLSDVAARVVILLILLAAILLGALAGWIRYWALVSRYK